MDFGPETEGRRLSSGISHRSFTLHWRLEVTSPAYQDASPIWSLDAFPCRVHVKVVEKLTPETAVPILDLRDRLTIFQGLKNRICGKEPFEALSPCGINKTGRR